MSKCSYALAIDAGGSYFKFCVVESKGGVVMDTHCKMLVDSTGSAENIYVAYENIIGKALKSGMKIEGIGISTPGPFDYVNCASLMKHKFQSIYGINLRETLIKRCGLPGSFPIKFIHDAHAFILGEHYSGSANGFDNVAGVTIGTGLGFGLIKNGKICDNGNGGPYRSIFKLPWANGILEDFVSKRGIIALYKRRSKKNDAVDVIDIEHMARDREQNALKTFAEAGEILGEALKPVAEETEIECLVLGGQISRAFPFMETGLKKCLSSVSLKKITVAQNIDCSALIGAANIIFNEV